METSKEVTVKKQNAVSTEVASMFADMDYSSSESKDLLIPKILLMQGSSERVKDLATHKAGDIIKSTTGEVYGSARPQDGKSLRFIPVYMYKTWVKHEILGKSKMQYIETYPVTPANTDQKWEQEETIEGVKHTYKLTKNINFYVILESDLGNPLAVPHVLTYRSTSSKAAAIVENWFSECNIAQKAKVAKDSKGNLMLPFAKIFQLSGKLDKNDEHSWFSFVTTEVDNISDKPELLAQAFNWYKIVSKYDHVAAVDNSDDAATSTASKVETEEKF